MIFRIDLNLYALVGIIMLIGIVKKNAIMMIDFALEAERKEGKSPAEAIFQGALIRFRPIMMTTMAALMATLPIALGLGAGGECQASAGAGRGGRPGLFPDRDPVHHPGDYIYLDKLQAAVRRRVNALLPAKRISSSPPGGTPNE